MTKSPPHGTQQDIERGLSNALARREEAERRHVESKQSRRPSKKALAFLRKAEKEERDWHAFKQRFERATACINELKTCPRCGEQADFEARDKGLFSASCISPSCEARWELRPHREGRIPVFIPDVKVASAQAALIDEQLGCDVLALPYKASDDSIEFLPPRAAPFVTGANTRPSKPLPTRR